MSLALKIFACVFFWGCVVFSILTIVVGQPFLDTITQLAWSLK